MSYYYFKDGDTLGPNSLDELRELCRRGEIPPDTQVCTEGAESWQPLSALGQIDESQPTETAQEHKPAPVAAPPPTPPRTPSQPPATAFVQPRFRGITSGQGAAIIVILTIMVILILGLFVFPFFHSILSGVLPSQEWEYVVVSIPDSSFTEKMNALGERGWELVFARRASDGSDSKAQVSYEMILKRPKRY